MAKPAASPGALVLLASAGAVALWSLTPVAVTAIGSAIDSTETFLLASIAAVLASLVIGCTRLKELQALWQSGTDLWEGAGWAAVSGAFLGMWYFCFYRALQEAPAVEAAAISFTWPLIAIFAMRVFSPKTAAPLKAGVWLLVGLSFLGAVLVTVSAPPEAAEGGRAGLLWAVAASIGSGMYLPFALRAMGRFSRALPHSATTNTFVTISLANVASLVLVVCGLLAIRQPVSFSGVDARVLLLCAGIGVGVYLVAEVAWTWSFERHGSLTLASLPYMSPAVSAILLKVIFGATITWMTGVGLAVIILSNLLLHLPGARKKPVQPTVQATQTAP